MKKQFCNELLIRPEERETPLKKPVKNTLRAAKSTGPEKDIFESRTQDIIQ